MLSVMNAADHWWAFALRGVAAVIFGILAFVWPGVTLAVLVLFWGAYALVDGILTLLAAFRTGQDHRWALVIEGVVGIGAGIVTFLWPGLTALVLVYIIAVWALITGVLEVIAAIRLRHVIENEWWLVLSGILSLIFGIALVIAPGAGALALIWLIAAMPSSSACYCSGLRFDSAASVNGTNSPRQPDAVRVTWPNQRTLKSAACTLHPGMPVTQGQREFGRLEEVIPQPDRIHVVRLITRRSSDGKLVSIPIDWASNVVDGQVLLTLDRDELDHLPEYVPPIPSAEARDRVQRALQEHPATAAAGIQVHDRDGSIELRGRVRDVETRTVASEVARGVRGTVPIRNRLRTEESTESQVSAIGYGYAWLHTLMERATGLDLEESQIARIEEFAEQKLVDLSMSPKT